MVQDIAKAKETELTVTVIWCREEAKKQQLRIILAQFTGRRVKAPSSSIKLK